MKLFSFEYPKKYFNLERMEGKRPWYISSIITWRTWGRSRIFSVGIVDILAKIQAGTSWIKFGPFNTVICINTRTPYVINLSNFSTSRPSSGINTVSVYLQLICCTPLPWSQFLFGNNFLVGVYYCNALCSFFVEVSKAITVTGLGGLLGCETSRIPHFLDNRLTDSGEVVSLTCLPCFTH
jgi:hypothetical protein